MQETSNDNTEEKKAQDKFDAFFKKSQIKKSKSSHVVEEMDNEINLLLAAKWSEYQALVKQVIVDHIHLSPANTELEKSLHKCIVAGELDVEKFKKITITLDPNALPSALSALKKLYDVSPLMLKISTDPVMSIPDKIHLLIDVYKKIDLSECFFQSDHPLHKDMPTWMTDIVKDPLGYQREDILNKLRTTKQYIMTSFQELLNAGIIGGVVIKDLSENNFEKLYQTHQAAWIEFLKTNDYAKQYTLLLEDFEKIENNIFSIETYLKKQAEKLQLNKIQLAIKSHQTILDDEILAAKNKMMSTNQWANDEIKLLIAKVNDLSLFSYLAPISTPFVFPEKFLPTERELQILCKLLFAKEIADELETSIHTKSHLRLEKPQQQFTIFEEKFVNAKNILKHLDEMAMQVSGQDLSGIGMTLFDELEKMLAGIKSEENKKTAKKK